MVFGAITVEAGKVGDLLVAVGKGTTQQSQSVEQVTSGVATLSQATQDNAASAEELAVTAKEIASHIGALRGLVSTFKVDKAAAGG